MYYRLRPPFDVTWIDMPFIDDKLIAEHKLDLDRLDSEWKPTEDRAFSNDLLRIALRHGVATSTGIAVNVKHTLDLGRSDTLRTNLLAMDDIQAEIRSSPSGELMERLIPGWNAHGEQLDENIRRSTERIAREAEEDLAAVLAAPMNEALATHWTNLGGDLPQPA